MRSQLLLSCVAGATLALGCASPRATSPTPAIASTASITPGIAPAQSPAQSLAPGYSGPVIDIHAHALFGEQRAALASGDGGPEEILALSEGPRIVKLGVIVVAPTPGIEQTRALNDQLAALVARRPERLFAIGTVHPADGEEALAELERMAELGFRMLKLHPITQKLDLGAPEVAAVVHKAGELGLPILFDFSGILNADDLGEYVMLAAQNPDAKLVLAHMGGTKFHELLVLSVLQEYPWYRNNIWVELSGVSEMYANSPYGDALVYVIRKIGVDRALFGSDYPFAQTPSQAIADVESFGFTAQEAQMIFHDNAAGLLGF